MGTEKRGTKVTGLNCKYVNVSLEVCLVMSGLQGPGSNPWNVVGWSGRCSDQRLTGRVSSPSGVSDRLLQRPDGAGGPALFSAQHQSLLRGCLRLLWLHVLQPREGAQLRRVSAGLKFKVCVQLERFLTFEISQQNVRYHSFVVRKYKHQFSFSAVLTCRCDI